MSKAKHAFCWSECVTSDAQATTAFYTQLFNWSSSNKTMGNGLEYHTFFLSVEPCGALHAMPDEMIAQGVPSHWAYFISTPDLAATLAKVQEAGGEVIQDIVEVKNSGKLGIITDPGGALLHIWEAEKEKGYGNFAPGQKGTPAWFDLMTPDAEAAIAFYGAVFGWEARDMELQHLPYWLLMDQDVPVGGMMISTNAEEEGSNSWIQYFNSHDVEADSKRAESLGGKILVPAQDVPVGRFSILADPSGAMFGLLWMKQQEK